jgi:hypothetical protein
LVFRNDKDYPALNGPYASIANLNNEKITDYSIGKTMIDASFSWSEVSEMKAARDAVFSLAKKHRVGFFDVSANDGQVWLPRKHEYIHVFGTGDSSKALGDIRIYSLTGSKPLQ